MLNSSRKEKVFIIIMIKSLQALSLKVSQMCLNEQIRKGENYWYIQELFLYWLLPFNTLEFGEGKSQPIRYCVIFESKQRFS